jgi:peptidoglycan/LPS O-acetylase OafA/YrhL
MNDSFRDALERRNIPALDGFRALAIALVIVDHYHLVNVPNMGLGATGVTLFFVLSGFLITWLLLEEDRKFGGVSLKAFYQRRFLRIFPGFYTQWLIQVAIRLAAHKAKHWPEMLSAFFYCSNYYAGVFDPPNMALLFTWSLAAEEQFYLLWPSLFSRFRTRLKPLTRILGGLIACALILRIVIYTLLHAKLRYLYSAFECRMDSMLFGCLTAVLIRRGALDRIRSVICFHSCAPALTIGAFAGAIGLEVVAPKPFAYTAGLSVDAILAAILLIQLITFHAEPAWKWIDARPLRFLGRISYSLYLYHLLVRDVVRRVGERWPYVAQQIIELAAMVLVASLSYYLIERPLIRRKKYRLPAGIKSLAMAQAR